MIGVGHVIGLAVAVGVDTAGFDDIGNAVVVAVQVGKIWMAIPVAVLRAVQIVRNAIVVEILVERIGHAVAVAVDKAAKDLRRAIAHVRNTVVIAVGGGIDATVAIGVQRPVARGDDIVRAVAIGIEVAEVGHAVAVRIGYGSRGGLPGIKLGIERRVGETRFNDIEDCVVVRIQVTKIRHPIAVGIDKSQTVGNAIVVGIDATGEVHIESVVDAIAVTIETGGVAFTTIEDAVVIGIGVAEVGYAVAIGAARKRGVVDAVAVGIGATARINIEGIVDAIMVGVHT